MNPYSITEIPVRYVLSWTQGLDRRLVVVPSVNSITGEAGPATTVRFPFKVTAPAYIEHGPIRHEVITISGFSGREDRQGSTRDGGEGVLSGPELFEAFKGFLEDYSASAAEKGGAINRLGETLIPKLELFATWEDVAWTVGKWLLQWRHTSVDGTLAYQWALRMEMVGRADERRVPTSPLLTEDLSPNELWMSVAGEQYVVGGSGDGQWHTAVSKAADMARAGKTPAVADLEKIPGPLSERGEGSVSFEADRATVALAVSNISGAGQAVQRAVDDCKRALARVSKAQAMVRSAIEFPAAIWADSLSVIDTAIREIDVFVEAYGDVDRFTARTLRSYEAPLLRTKRAIERTFGKAGQARVPAQSSGPGGPVVADRITAGAGMRCVIRTLNAGETLPLFALRVMGSRELWTLIARVNGITDPWRVGIGIPIGTGSYALLVPAQVGAGVPRDGTNDIFGQCWRLDADAQLVWRGSSFDIVGGSAAWVQAIAMRYRHPLGTLASAPECGLIDIIGESSASTDLARLAVNVRSQALRDSRTSAVERLRLTREGDTIVVVADICPVDGEKRELSVPIMLEGMP